MAASAPPHADSTQAGTGGRAARRRAAAPGRGDRHRRERDPPARRRGRRRPRGARARGPFARRAARQGHVHERPARRGQHRGHAQGARGLPPRDRGLRRRALPRGRDQRRARSAEPRHVPRPRAAAHRHRRRGDRRLRREPPDLRRRARALRGHEALAARPTRCWSRSAAAAPTSRTLRSGEPIRSGTYPLGSIRMRQSLASWRGTHEQRIAPAQAPHPQRRRRHPAREPRCRRQALHRARRRHALRRGAGARRPMPPTGVCELPRDALLAFCDRDSTNEDVDQLAERYQLPAARGGNAGAGAAGVPRAHWPRPPRIRASFPAASLRLGLLLDIARRGESHGIEDFGKHVLASAAALGEKYRYDVAHAPPRGATLATRLYDELKTEHGLGARERLLLEVAALLHDIGNYVSLRSHHKHTQYILLGVRGVRPVARGHGDGQPRRALPPPRAAGEVAPRVHARSTATSRVVVNKLAAILRLANALDADHMQKVKDINLRFEDGVFVIELEGAGDMTIERLTAQSRCDLMSDVFGRRVSSAGAGARDMKTAQKTRRKEPELFLNRELSWLEFNARVLEEAHGRDRARCSSGSKFALIVASNLDEFFMVRVAALKNAVDEGDVAPDIAGLTPAQQLRRSRARAHEHRRRAVPHSCATICCPRSPRAASRSIRVARARRRRSAPRSRVRSSADVLPALTPLAIDSSRPFPMLAELSTEPRRAARAAPRASDAPRLAVVQVPSRLAAARAPGRHRRRTLRRARRRHAQRAGRAVPRADSCSRRWPSASRATPSSTSTTRAADDFLQAIEARAAPAAHEPRRAARDRAPPSATRCCSLLSSRLEVAPERRVPRARAGARPARARAAARSARARRPARSAAQAADQPRAGRARRPVRAARAARRAAAPSVRVVRSGGRADRAGRATIPTCWRSSRRCTAPAATRRSCARSPRAAEQGKQVTVLIELTARFDETVATSAGRATWSKPARTSSTASAATRRTPRSA